MMVDRKHRLPIFQQCRILELSRSSVYYRPQPVSAADLALMHRIDELHLQHQSWLREVGQEILVFK